MIKANYNEKLEAVEVLMDGNKQDLCDEFGNIIVSFCRMVANVMETDEMLVSMVPAELRRDALKSYIHNMCDEAITYYERDLEEERKNDSCGN